MLTLRGSDDPVTSWIERGPGFVVSSSTIRRRKRTGTETAVGSTPTSRETSVPSPLPSLRSRGAPRLALVKLSVPEQVAHGASISTSNRELEAHWKRTLAGPSGGSRPYASTHVVGRATT